MFLVKNVIFLVFTNKISLFGYPPIFSFCLIINSFHKDLMWEALVFSKEIVLVFSKVGASRRIYAHPAPYPAPLSQMGHRSALELQRSGISAVSGVTGEGEGEGGGRRSRRT